MWSTLQLFYDITQIFYIIDTRVSVIIIVTELYKMQVIVVC